MTSATIIDCIQGDATWMACRLGCVTSSRIAAVMSVLTRKSGDRKAGESGKVRDNLKVELAGEILTGNLSEHYMSRWMEEGREKEPFARAAYQYIKDVQTIQIGFAYHPTIKMAGCSPDDLVGAEGGAEYKCPKTETHLRYLKAGVVPKEYIWQLRWQIACMGWEWCDFVSHDPSFKKSDHRTLIVRLQREDKIIEDMESKVIAFNEEVQQYIEELDPEFITKQLAGSLRAVKARKAADDAAMIAEIASPESGLIP